MSFIYEALKRAEDDNQQRVTTPVRSDAGVAVFRGRTRWWAWALIGVLGANALVAGTWMIVRGQRSPNAPTAAGGSGGAGAPRVSPPPVLGREGFAFSPAAESAGDPRGAAPASHAPASRGLEPLTDMGRHGLPKTCGFRNAAPVS